MLVWVAAALLASALSGPGSARAGPGDGLKVGDGRLHPLLELEQHYIDNPAYALPKDARRDLYLLGRGGFALEAPSPRLDLELKSALSWQEYLGVYGDSTEDLSDWGGELRLNATLNKDSAFVLRLSQDLVRQANPTPVEADPASGVEEPMLTTQPRTVSTSKVGFDVKPGGGALILTGGYGAFVDWSSAGSRTLRHMPELRATWKFLPKTAVTLQTSGTIAQYPFGDRFPGGVSNPTTSSYQTYLGLIGDLTPRISVVLKAGYALVLEESGPLSDMVGQAEASYNVSPSQSFKLGYLRLYEPASLYGYFGLNRGYARYDHQMFGTTQLAIETSYNDYDFGPALVAEDGSGNRIPRHRRDALLIIDGSLTHNFSTWLFAGVSNRYERRTSSSRHEGYERDDFCVRLGLRY